MRRHVGREGLNTEGFCKALWRSVTGAGSWSTWDVIYDAPKAVNNILPENSACKGEVIKRGGAATPEWIEPSSI